MCHAAGGRSPPTEPMIRTGQLSISQHSLSLVPGEPKGPHK
jgi:hypothetical protein